MSYNNNNQLQQKTGTIVIDTARTEHEAGSMKLSGICPSTHHSPAVVLCSGFAAEHRASRTYHWQ